MSIFETASSSSEALIEPGTYVLKVVRIEPAGEGSYGPSAKWVFHVAQPTAPEGVRFNEQGGPYEFWAFSSTKMTPKARAHQWIAALLGRPLGDGEDIDERSLIGRQMVALVVHAEGADGKVRAKISTEVPAKPFGRQGAPSASAGRPPVHGSNGQPTQPSPHAFGEPEPLPF